MFLEYVVIAGLVLFCGALVSAMIGRGSFIFYSLVGALTSVVVLLAGFSLYWRSAAGLAAGSLIVVVITAEYLVFRCLRL